jgi:hypothetical protein
MELVALMLQSLATAKAEEIRAAISYLEETIKQDGLDLGPESCPVQHFFAPGSYAREITMPEGTVVIGKIHRHAHINVVSKGRVRVLTYEGVQEYTAPCTFVSTPGTKRLVLMLEDTVWTTVHVTDKTDLAEIEREVIAQDYESLELSGDCRRLQ